MNEGPIDVAYFVHGHGRGHASRTRFVVPALEAAGLRVRVFAGGDACEALDGTVAYERIEANVPRRATGRTFARRCIADHARFLALRPRLVVSDGDAPSVHAARALGAPSIAVGHGLVFGHCRLPEGLDRALVLRERINAGSSSWPSRRRVAVSFLPLVPHTLGTHVARADLAPVAERSEPSSDALVAYFHGADGTRALVRLVERGHRVVCFGEGPAVPGVERRPRSATGFAEALRACRGVVASAGSQLIAECAMLDRPILAVYAHSFVEQRMNGAMLDAAGLGVAVPEDSEADEAVLRFETMLDRPSPAIGAAIRAMPTVSSVVLAQVRAALTFEAREPRRAA